MGIISMIPLPRGERLGEGFCESVVSPCARGSVASGIPPLAPPFQGGGLSDRTRLSLRVLFMLALAAFWQCPAFASDGGGHGAPAEGGHGARPALPPVPGR